ncbi:hypothetical protein LTR36_003119 [Oleoguttula mirabilis]|uniref:Uncharacterized protein n=1 Tax=Oleoguttula mirabilis TaxID=1507867 RepID=A0AAV9JX70_9PEZI|nr:hypothetical protein LTR36_003119 [Oleoguttula mirabilis]
MSTAQESSEGLLYTQACKCQCCSDLRQACTLIDGVFHTDGLGVEEEVEVSVATTRLRHALRMLQCRHQPEVYEPQPRAPERCRYGVSGSRAATREPEVVAEHFWSDHGLAEAAAEADSWDTYVDHPVERDSAALPEALGSLSLGLNDAPSSCQSAVTTDADGAAYQMSRARHEPSEYSAHLRRRLPDEDLEDEVEEHDGFYTAPRRAYEKHYKFVVCDHCRSHGLPCNEAAVCEQCILHEVACVHRRCRLSPQSKAACPRPSCRYVHEDYLPRSPFEQLDADWIILPGNLRGYLCAERKCRRFAPRCFSTQVVRRFVERQRVGLEGMREFVQRSGATWESVAMVCTCVEDERAAQMEGNEPWE